MDFPLQNLLDEGACYAKLLTLLHPQGLACPACQARENLSVHRRRRQPLLDYQCAGCGRVFNAYTGTVWQSSPWRPSELLLFLRGIAQGVSTAQLARELGCERTHLLDWRHRLQALAQQALPSSPLPDAAVEADEMYQNAGKKGVPHGDPDDPPRRRGKKARGHGSWERDRPPVAGVVGRASGQSRMEVVEHADRVTLEDFVQRTTVDGVMLYTDEWPAYNQVPETGRGLGQVCHAPGRREWARDDDGDGVREVHNNTLEGIWTGLRNFLRIFRGVSKWYLAQYVALFEWGHNLKIATDDFLRALLGVRPSTNLDP
jgi:transposase